LLHTHAQSEAKHHNDLELANVGVGAQDSQQAGSDGHDAGTGDGERVVPASTLNDCASSDGAEDHADDHGDGQDS